MGLETLVGLVELGKAHAVVSPLDEEYMKVKLDSSMRLAFLAVKEEAADISRYGLLGAG